MPSALTGAAVCVEHRICAKAFGFRQNACLVLLVDSLLHWILLAHESLGLQDHRESDS